MKKENIKIDEEELKEYGEMSLEFINIAFKYRLEELKKMIYEQDDISDIEFDIEEMLGIIYPDGKIKENYKLMLIKNIEEILFSIEHMCKTLKFSYSRDEKVVCESLGIDYNYKKEFMWEDLICIEEIHEAIVSLRTNLFNTLGQGGPIIQISAFDIAYQYSAWKKFFVMLELANIFVNELLKFKESRITGKMLNVKQEVEIN